MNRKRRDTPREATGEESPKKRARHHLYKGVGDRLIWARDERELKQCWVALVAGLDGGRYNDIENANCQRVCLDEIIPVATVLSCSLEWLLRGGKLDPWLPGTAPERGKNGVNGNHTSPHRGRTKITR